MQFPRRTKVVTSKDIHDTVVGLWSRVRSTSKIPVWSNEVDAKITEDMTLKVTLGANFTVRGGLSKWGEIEDVSLMVSAWVLHCTRGPNTPAPYGRISTHSLVCVGDYEQFERDMLMVKLAGAHEEDFVP